MARFMEFAGHQNIIIRRYVQETIRDVARQRVGDAERLLHGSER